MRIYNPPEGLLEKVTSFPASFPKRALRAYAAAHKRLVNSEGEFARAQLGNAKHQEKCFGAAQAAHAA